MTIVVKNVSKRFNKFQALDDVSVEIPGGGLVAFDYRDGRIARFGPDGRRLWQWRRRGGVEAQAHGSFVYARDRAAHRTYVLDARSGRRVGTLPTARPPFIVPDL